MLNKKKFSYLVVMAMVTGCSGNFNPPIINEKIDSYSKNVAHKQETFLTEQEIATLEKEYGQFKTQSFSADYLGKKLKKWQSAANNSLMARELEFARLFHPILYCIVRSDPANAAVKTYITTNGPTLVNDNAPLATFLSTGCGGGEFQPNTYTNNTQKDAAVAMDSDGDFVVVWNSNGSSGSDTDLYSIQGQRYSSIGLKVGPEFQVNTYTTGNQRYPSVAMDGDGDFVVTWQSSAGAGTDTTYSIQGQRYSNATTLTPVGAQFQVNTYTTSNQLYPAVAMDVAGDFVVAWNSNGSSGSDTDLYSIQGQRYSNATTLTPVGSQFQINTYRTANQMYPSAAMDSDGDFVVAWQSNGSSGTDTLTYSIQGQRYSSATTLTPVGSEFQVNTYTTGNQMNPSAAMDVAGDFVVTWNSLGSSFTDTVNNSIQGQRYSNATTLTPVGSQFQVNTYTNNSQYSPAAAMDSDGDFVVTWQSSGGSGTDTSVYSIQGQRYSSAASLTTVGPQFQVNTFTTGSQLSPAVAMDVAGDFVVIWQSSGSSGSDSSVDSIQGQKYNSAGVPD